MIDSESKRSLRMSRPERPEEMARIYNFWSDTVTNRYVGEKFGVVEEKDGRYSYSIPNLFSKEMVELEQTIDWKALRDYFSWLMLAANRNFDFFISECQQMEITVDWSILISLDLYRVNREKEERESFLKEVYEQAQDDDQSLAISHILGYMAPLVAEDFNRQESESLCDRLFEVFDVERMSIRQAIAALTVTLPLRLKLQKRKEFCRKAQDRIDEACDPEDAKAMLQGLG